VGSAYLQIAFDIVDLAEVKRVLSEIPGSDHVLIEIGTPLVKMHGVHVVKEVRSARPDRL